MFSEAAMGQALVQRAQLRPEHVRGAFTLLFESMPVCPGDPS